jgi:hypothetical protein
MQVGRRNLALAGQIEQPHKPARPPVLVLVYFHIIVRLDQRLSEDGRQFRGDSWEYGRPGQPAHGDAPCSGRHLGCSVLLGRTGTSNKRQ